MTVCGGKFNLFVPNDSNPSEKKMKYEAVLMSKEGKSYFFQGFKDIKNDSGLDIWLDTTTLFITVHEGSDEAGKVLGKGKLKIAPGDFVKQLTTMKSVNHQKGVSGMKALTAFGKFFAGNLWDTYVKGGLR